MKCNQIVVIKLLYLKNLYAVVSLKADVFFLYFLKSVSLVSVENITIISVKFINAVMLLLSQFTQLSYKAS